MAWTALAAILLFKSTLEVKWMSEAHPSFDPYRRERKRFIHWIF